MNKLNNLVTGIVAVGLVVVLVLIWNLPVGPAGQDDTDGKSYGALSGPDILSPYISVGGMAIWATGAGTIHTQATTTPCNIAAAPNASSTLMLGSGLRVNASTTASKIRAYKSADPNATTTFLFGGTVAANVGGVVAATTTTDNFKFNEGDYLVFDVNSTVVANNPANGFRNIAGCNAWFVAN